MVGRLVKISGLIEKLAGVWPTRLPDLSTCVEYLETTCRLRFSYKVLTSQDQRIKSGKEEVTCQLHFAVNIWKAKLQLFSPSPLPPLLFLCTLKFFVLVPSLLWFSALLKHFHYSDQIELLSLDFKIYTYIFKYVSYSLTV